MVEARSASTMVCNVREQFFNSLLLSSECVIFCRSKAPSITANGGLTSFMVKELEDLRMATSITEITPVENGRVKVRGDALYYIDSILPVTHTLKHSGKCYFANGDMYVGDCK